MSGQYNINIVKGTTFRKKLTLTDANNTAINLAGASCVFQIYSNSAIISNLNGSISNNSITFLITDEDTTLINYSQALYRILLTYANGDTKLLMSGTLTVGMA